MTYFLKTSRNGVTPVIPPIILPLIYKDCIDFNYGQNKTFYWSNEFVTIPTKDCLLPMYQSCWYLSKLLLFELVEEKLGYEKDYIKVTEFFSSNLGSDSLDIVEIALYLEKTSGISIPEGVKFETLTDFIDCIFFRLRSKIPHSNIIWESKIDNFSTTF